jgi:putative endonuclease
MNENQLSGEEGERKAVEYLRSLGYVILDTNWRHGHKELDVVARDRNVLVIVEVKTRGSIAFGEPEAFVNRQKQRNIISAAGSYLRANNLNLEIRFDIISVIKVQNDFKVKHIENAFYPIVN